MAELDFKLKNGRKIYRIEKELCVEMLEKAEQALTQCYPNAGEGYASAVLTSKGNMFTGASYKSDTYTLTLHGEAVALAHAAQHGESEIVAITGPNCHICKQLIWESSLHSGIEILVILEESGEIKKIPISELMPYPWPERVRNT